MHIDNIEERNWLEQRMEPSQNQWPLEPALKRRVLQDVIGAESFENFLDTRFKGHKRFGLEGGESAIAIIEEILDRAANAGTAEVVIGMAHRGRLVLLANIAGKSMVQLFAEFEGDDDPDSIEGSGDVKYHLGGSQERTLPSGKKIKVTVAFNPSHLEAVNPVVEGFVRAEQDMLKDFRREKILPLVIHGDAAMAGQGIVAEAFNYSKIPGYDTGGTHSPGDQQSDRIHYECQRGSNVDLLLRCRAVGTGSGLSRQWRRSGSMHPRDADLERLPPAFP